MKIVLMLVNLFFVLSFTAQNSQKTDIQVTYNFSYKKNIESLNFTEEKASLIIKSSGESLFVLDNMLATDSIQKIREFNISDMMLYKSPFNYLVKKNFNSDELTFVQVIGKELYAIKESNKLKWEFTSEKKLINGYDCKKALVTYYGRQWIAWYTTKIPINAGPYKFNGLPGLILEIHDSENIFNFKAGNITFGNFDINSNIQNYFYTENKKGLNYISVSEFYKLRENYYKMSLNEKLKFMNRNEDYTPKFVATRENGEVVNTDRKPKSVNFIERFDVK
nr:GLPGLI family protein [uncultured Flavobacterium sp.]